MPAESSPEDGKLKLCRKIYQRAQDSSILWENLYADFAMLEGAPLRELAPAFARVVNSLTEFKDACESFAGVPNGFFTYRPGRYPQGR